jgi:predicted nucleic acid-binding Zn ribbon protein
MIKFLHAVQDILATTKNVQQILTKLEDTVSQAEKEHQKQIRVLTFLALVLLIVGLMELIFLIMSR